MGLNNGGGPSGPITTGTNYAVNAQPGILDSNGSLLSYNGPKNYASGGSFENGTTGSYSLGTIGTLTNGLPTGTPTFGSGASGTLSFSLTSTNPLAGITSFQLISTSASTVGNMLASPVMNIDIEDQAKALSFKQSYSFFSGVANVNLSGTSSNSFAVAIYDVTNSQFLGVNGAFSYTQGTNVGTASGIFQTNSTTLAIRFIIYFPTASVNVFTMNIDSIFVGPQITAIAPAMTDTLSFTPTIGGSTTAPTPNGSAVNTMYYKRSGDEVFLRYNFSQTAAGTAGSGAYLFPLPSGLTLDTTKAAVSTAGTGGGGTILGTFNVANTLSGSTNSAQMGYVVAYNTTNLVLVYTLAGGSAAPAQEGQIGSTNFSLSGSPVYITFEARVPIVGWSSNTAMSADSSQNVITASVSNLTTTTVTANANLKFTTTNYDSSGAINLTNGTFLVTVSGYYRCTLVGVVSGTTGATIFLYNARTAVQTVAGALPSTSGIRTNSFAEIQCNAGDLLSFQIGTSITLGDTVGLAYFERVSGPAIIQATDRVAMRAYGSSTTISGSAATVVYGTKQFDTTGSYSVSTGIWTCPSTNYYQANACIAVSGTIALNNTLDIQIQQSGSATQIAENTEYAGGVQTALVANVGDVFFCLQGDTLKVQVLSSITTPVIVASTSKNWFSIAKVGGN